ncbi:MAG: efflux RND transporter permease subunit [Actinomycetota bacterium]|nr:efflux RND transporter permease subunit [Actinomycetota bacterium]
MFARLAHHVTTRPHAVLLAAVAFLALAGVFGGPVAGLLSTGDDFQDPGAQSVAAVERLERASGAEPSPTIIALVRSDGPGAAERVEAELIGVEGIARTVVDTSGEGGAAYVAAFLAADADPEETTGRVAEAFDGDPAVALGGGQFTGEAIGEQVGSDLARAELLAFPVLFLLSLLIFRSFVGALLPLGVGALTIMGTFLGLRVINELTLLSIFALNLAIALGLGLAIDYTLFVVSRFREELSNGLESRAAVARTMRTAGHTVLFSALTVAAALLSLLVFPQRFLYSMGLAGGLAALIAMVVSLTALPAVLALMGHRLGVAAPRRERGFWQRWTRGVMRRPGLVAAATAAVLVVAGLPFLGVNWVGVDASVLPASAAPRVVDDTLRTDFAGAGTPPVTVALAAGEERADEVAAYAQRLGALPGAAEVTAPRYLGEQTWQVDVRSAAPELAEASLALVDAVRATDAPGEALVGGQSARFVDQQAGLGDRLPLALTVLALTTLMLLFAMTGSVVLPVKALIMNLLTVCAAFGLLVLVFQDGRLEGLLDYTSQGGLEATQPLVLLALVFGLSTDYGVFLLARIKEEHDRGAATDDAVAFGLQRTGRIVTCAAILFCVAIGAFATSEIVFIKQVGLGTAAAVLIDATIVRALLVPALMKLLGDWNWWAPRPLRRLHERFGWREEEAELAAAA